MTASDGAEGDGAGVIADRYRLMSELGRGAMGVVWLARDERLGRTVAVKVLRPGVGLGGAGDTQAQHSQLRARREARIAARLHHPHAVAVFDVVDHDGRPCLVMEYVPSRSLAEVLADGTVLAPAEAAELGEQVASALGAAHDAGIVHRDVKPGNILLTEDGTAKLTDFGISRASGDVTVTATGEMLGTPAYFAPEVAQGHAADTASDVFSLGATLYAATEGVPPFGTGPTAMALLLRIVNDEIRPPEQTGPLADTLMWMLRNDPADRPSLDEVRRALSALAASPSPDAPTTPVPTPTPTLASQSADTPSAARNAEPGTAPKAGSQASNAAGASDVVPEREVLGDRPEAAGAPAVSARPRATTVRAHAHLHEPSQASAALDAAGRGRPGDRGRRRGPRRERRPERIERAAHPDRVSRADEPSRHIDAGCGRRRYRQQQGDDSLRLVRVARIGFAQFLGLTDEFADERRSTAGVHDLALLPTRSRSSRPGVGLHDRRLPAEPRRRVHQLQQVLAADPARVAL